MIDLAFQVDLLSDETVTQKADQLFYLSRPALKRRLIDDLWKRTAATSPKSVAKAMLMDEVRSALRRALKKSTGQNIDDGEIAKILRDSVLRPECFEA